MANRLVEDKASQAEAKTGSVHMHGPSDVDFSLTPRAALEPARRIEEAAVKAIINQANGSRTSA